LHCVGYAESLLFNSMAGLSHVSFEDTLGAGSWGTAACRLDYVGVAGTALPGSGIGLSSWMAFSPAIFNVSLFFLYR
jgi:hypothetical protein